MRFPHQRAVFLVVAAVLAVVAASAQYSVQRPATQGAQASAVLKGALLGASDGLYRVNDDSSLSRLVSGTEFRKILRAGDSWYFLS